MVLILCLGMSLGGIAGCQDAKSPPEPQKTETTQATDQTKNATLTPANHADLKTPEATLRQMVEGLRQNRPEVIWQAMPRRFRGDINSLVHDFARKMDPELWSHSFATWKKARPRAGGKESLPSQPSKFEDPLARATAGAGTELGRAGGIVDDSGQ